MNKLRFFIYDNVNDLYEDFIKIDYFEYNSNTTIWDLYKFLAKKYVDFNIDGLKSVKDVIEYMSFKTIGLDIDVEINSENGIFTINDLFLNNVDKLICILPLYPIGGTVAEYRNYRIIIRTNEKNHKHTPHVHIYSPLGEDIFLYLETLEYKGDFSDTKAKKKILKYIKIHKKSLIRLYNDYVSEKNVEKHVIDIID